MEDEMRKTAITVTELVRDFSNYLNRAVFRDERFILTRGRKPVAELRPLPSARSLGELEGLLRSLPSLGAAQAEEFALDMEAARRQIPREGLRDPWPS
jgi:hypothetical protein